jgi:hypothetical protein
MSSKPLLAGAAPLLAALPSQASASEAVAAWGGPDASAVALLGVVAAFGWHQLATHRADLAERWHHAGDQVRHAIAYARSHAHLPHRR